MNDKNGWNSQETETSNHFSKKHMLYAVEWINDGRNFFVYFRSHVWLKLLMKLKNIKSKFYRPKYQWQECLHILYDNNEKQSHCETHQPTHDTWQRVAVTPSASLPFILTDFDYNVPQ